MAEEQVNVRLSDTALKNLRIIQDKMDLGSRAQAIAISVRLVKKFMEIEKEGATIYIEEKGKMRGRLIII